MVTDFPAQYKSGFLLELLLDTRKYTYNKLSYNANNCLK